MHPLDLGSHLFEDFVLLYVIACEHTHQINAELVYQIIVHVQFKLIFFRTGVHHVNMIDLKIDCH